MVRVLCLRAALISLSLAAAAGLGSSLPVMAQDESWSQPVLVFESQGQVSHPRLVADQFGQVHAFWVFTPDPSTGISGRQVYYARLDQPELQPVDIFLDNSNFAALRATGSDKQLFLMWDGNNVAEADISPALSAQAWQAPQQLVVNYSQSGLVTAPDNSIWLAYGDSTANAVFVRKLNSATDIWGPPQFVSNTSNANAAPDAVQLTVAEDGPMHAVWSEYQLPNGWPPLGVYYARSTDNGQNWSAPREVATDGFNQPNIKAGLGSVVYLTWLGMTGVGGKYYAQSDDDGQNWSGTTSLLARDQGGGSEGPPNMAVDSAGHLHVLFSANNCVWYMHLDAGGWTDPDCISRGVPSSHTEEPIMALGLGNRLHVLWWANDRQLWYNTRQLKTTGEMPLPTLTPLIPTDVPPTLTPTPVPTPTYLPDFGAPMDPSLPAQSGTWAVIAGIVPVLLLVIVVALRRLNR